MNGIESELYYTKMFLLSSDIKTDSILINFVIVKFLIIRLARCSGPLILEGWPKIQ